MKGQDATERFYDTVRDWHDENKKLANKKIDLIIAKRDLKSAEADVYQEKTPKELGANEAARKAAMFIITYPQIAAIDIIQFDVYRLEVSVDYHKAMVNYYETALMREGYE